jgi:hypothetical protein
VNSAPRSPTAGRLIEFQHVARARAIARSWHCPAVGWKARLLNQKRRRFHQLQPPCIDHPASLGGPLRMQTYHIRFAEQSLEGSPAETGIEWRIDQLHIDAITRMSNASSIRALCCPMRSNPTMPIIFPRVPGVGLSRGPNRDCNSLAQFVFALPLRLCNNLKLYAMAVQAGECPDHLRQRAHFIAKNFKEFIRIGRDPRQDSALLFPVERKDRMPAQIAQRRVRPAGNAIVAR